MLLLLILFFTFQLASNSISQVNKSAKNIGYFKVNNVLTTENFLATENEGIADLKKTDKGTNLEFELPDGEKIKGFAGTFVGSFDKEDALFYCVDIYTGLNWKDDYLSDGSTAEEITYIMNNYYPYKDKLLKKENDEAAAVQMAIWHFSDGVDPNTLKKQDEIKERALSIIADANENAGSFVAPNTISISPALQNLELNETAQFEILILDIDGNPISNATIRLETTKGELSNNIVNTNSEGKAVFSLTSLTGGVSQITAFSEIEIPHGTKFISEKGADASQKLVLATPVEAEASAFANVNWNSNKEDCDGDGDNNISNFDGYQFELISVSLNDNNTSTWEYKVTGKGAPKDLSHWVLALCEDHNVLSSNFDGNKWEVNTDPRTGVSGLKYDVEIGKDGESETFIFTLDGHYDVAPIQVSFKAGTSNFYCTINGPSCDFGGNDCENNLGNFIWHDNNPADGIQNNGEKGIEGVIVELLDGSNNVISSDITNENGLYLFSGINNGNYSVRIADENFAENGVFYSNDEVKSKWHLTKKEAGNDENVDSNGDENLTASVTLDCGDNLSIDFGFYKTGISFDKNGPEISVYGEDIVYNFSVKNLGDVPFSKGVFVYDQLINTEGDFLIKQKENLLPNEEWEFEYALQLDNPACDLVVVNTANVAANPVLTSGEELEKLEATSSTNTTIICKEPAEIGNKVWIDENKNGLQDEGEPGVEGVNVKLFDCENNYVSSLFTDEDGNYLFTELIPGDYKLQFVLPNDYEFTVQNAGDNSAIDSDANPEDGKTVCTELEAGESDLTWDAGIVEIIRKSDLKIEKTSNSSNSEDGDVVNYQITVTNNGPDAASGVTVYDVLGDGLDFVSSSSLGDFNPENGIWNVGNLNNGQSATLSIDVKMNSKNVSLGTFDLGIAKGYNLFLLEDLNAPSSDVEGKAAIARDVTIANYSVGYVLNSSYANQDVLVVGRDLFFGSGRIYYGNVAYGNSTNLPISVASIDGELRKDYPIDFEEAGSYLKSLSSTLSEYEVNETATVRYEGSRIFLDGEDPFLNIFNVGGAELSLSTDLNINVPNGSVALINIDGDNIIWSGGLEITGTDKTNILYNFNQATNIKISDIDVRGSILAPKAVIDFPHGLVSGQLIAKSMFGAGQVNNNLFVGNIPAQKEINNVAEIIESNSIDPNLDNNISTAQVTLEITNDPSGDPNNENDDWTSAGTFASNEIIWTMATDNEGVMYAGTWGGNIYKSANEGAEWTNINDGMEVGYIWSIAIDNSNGNIWAATEKGLYLSESNGDSWSLNALANNDVRAVITDGAGHVYAGVWGAGVFEKSAISNEFTELNEGLTINAVHALAINSLGDLYAGTFGGGVYKLLNGTTEWISTETPAQHIWALGVTSQDDIFAGSYGEGIFGLYAGDESWFNLSNDLPNQYVYSITVDQSDNVYLTTWNGGVQKLAGSGSDNSNVKGGNSIQSVIWEPIGMDGFGVSTLIVNHVTSALFAGTNNGQIFKKADAPTKIENEVELPTEFGLEQNFPNPFNPSTVIKYSLPVSEHVTLRLYDILGNEIALLINEVREAGVHNFNLSVDNYKLTSGVYLYRLQAGKFVQTKKMILLK